ncbi:hypothetical protein ACWIGI_13455 [Nocardia sp. NPDC055321]
MTRRSTCHGAVASAFAALACGAALTAPHAGADVLSVSVASGADGLLTGCAYTVTAKVDSAPYQPGAVTFWNFGDQIPGLGDYHADSGTVTTTWTPTRLGSQSITAVQTVEGGFNTRQTITVDVAGAGINTGTSCLRAP